MKITAIPREDMNSVSTRVHYYYYLNNLPDGYEWERHSKEYGDVLYVQKLADDNTIKIAKKAKRKGVPVVYDCDDNPYEKPGKRRVTMLKLADAVTTDTEYRGEQLKMASGIKHCYVIPECIDYWDMIKKVEIRDRMESLVTFGNNSNTVNALKYLKYVDLEKRHINSKPISGAGNFVKWKLNTFVSEFCKSDVCFLAHNDDLKSNLKLLVSMYMGMPTIVTNTRYYKKTLKKIGLKWMVAKEPKDIVKLLKKLSDKKVRIDVSERYKEYDFSRHTPSHSGLLLSEVFKHVQKNRS